MARRLAVLLEGSWYTTFEYRSCSRMPCLVLNTNQGFSVHMSYLKTSVQASVLPFRILNAKTVPKQSLHPSSFIDHSSIPVFNLHYTVRRFGASAGISLKHEWN